MWYCVCLTINEGFIYIGRRSVEMVRTIIDLQDKNLLDGRSGCVISTMVGLIDMTYGVKAYVLAKVSFVRLSICR